MKYGWAAAASLLVMAMAASAAAASAEVAGESAEVEQVVVNGQRTATVATSATKTTTPLIETPQSITVIDNQELVRRNALSISQALTYVAGVGPNQRGNVATRYDQLTIRGFSPGVFLDGMRIQGGTYSTPQIDFHRIDSVDVIKGPASVLYGNSTPGGLINLSSKLPIGTPHGSAEVAAGNFKTFRGAVDVGGPIDGTDKFLYRVIGGAESSDGFINHTENRRYYVSPMLSIVPTDATSLTLIAAYQRDPKGGSYGSAPPIGSAVKNPLGRIGVDFYDGEPTYEAFDRKVWSASALFRHDFSDTLRYRANLRHLDVSQHYRSVYSSSLLADLRTMIRGGGGSDEKFSTFTFDNSLVANFATGPLNHEVLVGLDYIYNEGRGFQRFVTGAAAGIPNLDLFNPVYGVTIPDVLAGVPATDVRRKQTGIYAQDQIKLGGLNLLGSIRQDWYDQRSTTSGVVTNLKQDKITYRLGALYAFQAGFSPYVSYSTSFEPQSGSDVNRKLFEPVTGRQYEAGLKYQPPGSQTILTLSVYDLARQNVPVSDPNNAGFSVQAGEVKTKGVELEGRGEILPGLEFSAAGAYMDTEFTKGNLPSTTIVNSQVLSGVTGTTPLGVPKWTASGYLSYELAKNSGVSGPLSGLTVGGGVRYVGGSDGTYTLVSSGVTTATRFRTDGYVLVDALLGYELGAANPRLQGLSFALNASNLLNTRHVTSCLSSNWCWFGAPRTIQGTVRYKW